MSEEIVDIDQEIESDDVESDLCESKELEEFDAREIPEEFAEIARKYKAHESLSDDELDKIADTAIEILRDMLGYFNASDADIDEYDGGSGELILDISNADLAILIGRHGKTLDAFQCLFTLVLNSRLGFRYPVVVDIEGYKNRRRQKIESVANNAAAKAISRGCDIRLHPMKPFERRLVHMALRRNTKVKTHSEGEEPNRYVVVSPVD